MHIYTYIHTCTYSRTGVCEKRNSSGEEDVWNSWLANTESGAGEQSPLQDCRAKTGIKGVCLFTDTGITKYYRCNVPFLEPSMCLT